MTTYGIPDVSVADKSVNGDLFLQFVEQCLVPVLQPFNRSNADYVGYNASIHHSAYVVKHMGAIVQFLPPFSPDVIQLKRY